MQQVLFSIGYACIYNNSSSTVGQPFLMINDRQLLADTKPHTLSAIALVECTHTSLKCEAPLRMCRYKTLVNTLSTQMSFP